MVEPRLDWAKAKARSVLEELEVRSVADLTDIEQICRERGVFVSYQPMKNLEGILIRSRRLIGIRSDIPNGGRKRFTIAHELGHWELHPHLDQLQACSATDIHAYRGSREELEANAFAAELLMPDFLLTEQLRILSPTLDVAKKLALRFQMSLTAAAVRLCEYSRMPMFVAFSHDGRLRWYRKNKAAEDYFFLRFGSQLDGDSLARYSVSQPDDPSEPQVVESTAWFPDDFRNDRFIVYEESVELGDYGVTMSLITVDD